MKSAYKKRLIAIQARMLQLAEDMQGELDDREDVESEAYSGLSSDQQSVQQFAEDMQELTEFYP